MKITFNKLSVSTGYIYISLDGGNTYDKVSIDDIKNNNNAYNLSDTQDYSKIKIKSNSTIISNLDVIKSISTVKSSYSNDNLEYLSYLAKGELKSDTTSEYPSYYQVRTLDDGTSIIYVDNSNGREYEIVPSTFNTALLTTPYIRRIVLLEKSSRSDRETETLVLEEQAASIYNYSVMEPRYIENYKLCISQYFANVNTKLSQGLYSEINEGLPYLYNQQYLYLYVDSEKNIYFNESDNLSDISMHKADVFGIRVEWEDDTHFIITSNVYGPINARYMVVAE